MLKKPVITVINTNTISVKPKLNSLIDIMDATDTGMVFVTETWLKDGSALQGDVRDLSLVSGIGLLCKNQKPAASNGEGYGGWPCSGGRALAL